MTSAPTLRQYQRDTHAAIWGAFEKGTTRQLVQKATGLGKTVVFAALLEHPPMKQWLGQFPARERKMLVIAHREELIMQAVDKIHRANPDLQIGVEQGDSHAGPFCDVIVASIQTLSAMKYRRLERLRSYGAIRIVIVDEAHHAAATTYRNCLVRLGFLPKAEEGDEDANELPDAAALAVALREWETIAPKDRLLIGFTATPNRSDAVGLGCVFQSIVYTYPIKRAIDDGWLAPITPWVVDTQTSLDEVRTVAGEFNQRDLADAVNTAERNEIAVAAWATYAKGRQTLAFTVDVAHAKAVAFAFQCRGIKAFHVSGETPKEERRQLLADYSAGRIQLLANCMVLTEGTDLPNTSCILHMKPTKSATLYEQMCLDAETEILTERGWLGIDDAVDCRVAAFDLVSGEVRWSDATRIERPRGLERMWGISSPHLDIRVTGGHRMVVRTRDQLSWRIEPAESLPAECRVPVCGVQQGDDDAPLTDDDITFLGLLLTDGNYNPRNGQVMLFQSERYPDVVDLVRRTLVGIGVKYTETVSREPSNFGPRSPLHRWTISRGQPRGRDSHLRGWGYLAAFVSPDGKSLTSAYERLSARQVRVLIGAIHAGDGLKRSAAAWTPGSLSICANQTLADALQSLCVRRGIRCNQAPRTDRLVMLHVSLDRDDWGIVRSATDGRPVWHEVPSSPEERVWCVTVSTGAIITRRHGKVAVVGNTGRGLRIHPGKTDCVVIDVVDIARRHSLQSAPTLYGLPPLKPEGKNLKQLADELEQFQSLYPQVNVEQLMRELGPLTLEELRAKASTFDIWKIPELGPIGDSLSLEWIKVGADAYRIQYPWAGDATEVLKVDRNMLGHFDVSATLRYAPRVRGQVARVQQQTLVANVDTLDAALRYAEHYVHTFRESVVKLKDKTAWWRRKPASDRQLSILNKRRIPYRPNLTMGEASSLIDLANARKGL